MTRTLPSDPPPWRHGGSLSDITGAAQITTSKTPCAFAAASLTIPAGGSVTVTSIYGRATNEDLYESLIKDRVNEVGTSAGHKD